jgi:ankyrin repeat protein
MDLTEADIKLLRAAYSGLASDVRAALSSSQVNKNCRENTGYHTETDPPKLPVYEENHKQLCRPNLFSRKPSAEYSGKLLRPLHFAAMSGHTEITGLLLGKARTNVCKDTEPSPFKYSIVNRHFQVAAKFLLDVHGRTTEPMGDDEKWNIFDTVLCLAEGPDDMTTANALLTRLQGLTMPPVQCLTAFDLTRIEQLITVAARENRHKIIRHILKWTPEVEVNIKSQWPTDDDGTLDATPLHFAVLKGHRDAVRELLTHLQLDASSEDSRLRTPLEIATTKIADSNTRREIVKLLMGRPEVKELVDRLYRDRQVFVDAANALLVGAALIASVTFAGWLQPPLGYTTYYDFPEPLPAPPSTYESYAAVKQHATVQAFWFFNSLSFFFAIATVLTGANAAMPSLENAFVGTVVKTVKTTLIYASFLFAISVVCVLCAFATAGFAVLPPKAKYKWSMISTVAIGAFACLICLKIFLCKLSKPICSRFSLKELAWKLLAPICLRLYTLVLNLTGR